MHAPELIPEVTVDHQQRQVLVAALELIAGCQTVQVLVGVLQLDLQGELLGVAFELVAVGAADQGIEAMPAFGCLFLGLDGGGLMASRAVPIGFR